jgi:transcriptional regulator with XRE-family HTH domain
MRLEAARVRLTKEGTVRLNPGESKLTYTAAAELTGFHRTKLSRLESGETSPTVADLDHLACVYGVEIDYFYTESTHG